MGGRSLILVAWSLAMLACGGENSHKPKVFYTGGTGGQAGAAGNTAGGTGGDGGSGGSSTGGSGACAELSLNVEGELAGTSVDGLLGAYGGGSDLGTRQLDFLLGGGIAMWDLPAHQDGDTISGPAWLSAPVDLELNGAQLLADTATVTLGTQPPIHFEGLHTLGNCPGTPVEGSLTFLNPEASSELGTISGTLDGTSVELSTDLGFTYFGGDSEALVYMSFDDHGMLFAGGSPSSMRGALILPSTSAEPDSVICFGKATLTGDVFADQTVVLEELSRTDTKWPGTAVDGTLTTSFCQGP